jgi:hypothetical protein
MEKTTRNDLISEIINTLNKLDSTGDIILQVENNTNKDLVYKCSKDSNNEYTLKIYKKDSIIMTPSIFEPDNKKITFTIHIDDEVSHDTI